MDLDRYLATHRPDWERLSQLSNGGRRGAKKLTDREIDELITLYQRTSAHLSYVRTYYKDAPLVAHLTSLVSSAGAIIYGTKPRSFRGFARFFTISFPAALWNMRRAIGISAAMFLLPAIVLGVWLANSPAAVDLAIPPAAREAYVNQEFEAYYESERASEFSSEVFTNNVRVGLLAFGSGVLLGIPTVFLMVFNGANVGVAGGVFAFVGESSKFYGLIAPHGLLELTCVIIAGGAGLRLGWAIISPGDKTRSKSLGDESRRAVVVLLGLVPAFAIAGLIEGFVTGQPWPTALRVGIGVLAEVAFVLYVMQRGIVASRKGFTGAIGEDAEYGWLKPELRT